MKREILENRKVFTVTILIVTVAFLNVGYASAETPISGDWKYSKIVSIKESSGETLVDYQVQVNLSGNFPVGANPDGRDIRFVDAAENVLSYWIEEFDATNEIGNIWVKVPEIPAGETVYLTMYYGNPSARAVSNGSAVFEFFDDFNRADSATIGNGWIESPDSSFSIENNQLKMEATQPGSQMVYKSFTPSNDMRFYAKSKRTAGLNYNNMFSVPFNDGVSNKLVSWNLYGGATGRIEYLDVFDWHDSGIYAETSWHELEFILYSNANVVDFYLDKTAFATDKTPSANNFGDDLVMFRLYDTYGQVGYVDHTYVRKYVKPDVDVVLGAEEEKPQDCIPPDPTDLQTTTGNFLINHTWQAGTGNMTDSYNVSINGMWDNGTTNAYYSNTPLSAHSWSNVTIWAYNNSGDGSLSSGCVRDNVQIPNNVITITNTSDWTGYENEPIYLNFDYTDADYDTGTFNTDATHGTLNCTTGIYRWETQTDDAGMYVWAFNVNDGYGSVDSYYATITVVAAPPSVAVITPNGGEVWNGGTTQDIMWTAADDVAVTSIDIYYSTDGGSTYPYTIATEELNDGVYSWTIPETPSTTCMVKVVAYDVAGNTGEDVSDANFEIYKNVAPVSGVTYSYEPLSSIEKVTGGGCKIPSPGNPGEYATFGFNTKNNLQFTDHGTGMNVHSESIDTLTASGSTATFSGTARVNGESGYSFTVEVEDNGEPGKGNDKFAISLTGPGDFAYSASGSLGGGNIQIHDESAETPMTSQPIEFDASGSYDSDGNIVEYRWDFGDGTYIEGDFVEIAHSYTEEGVYTVTITVVDDAGATDVTTITVTVEGEGEEISGNVFLDDISLSVPEEERHTIGELIEITGSATLTNTGDATSVTVEISVGGSIIYQYDTPLLPGEETIPVSVEWLPMSSGAHVISLQVRECVGDEYYWIGPTNDLSAEMRVFIKKVT